MTYIVMTVVVNEEVKIRVLPLENDVRVRSTDGKISSDIPKDSIQNLIKALQWAVSIDEAGAASSTDADQEGE